MATWIEDRVDVSVRLTRSQGGDRCFVAASAWGTDVDDPARTAQIETTAEFDVTGALTESLRTAVDLILDAAEARAKQHFRIP